MSLAAHVMVLLIIIGAGGSLKPSNKLLVIDFRMENPVGPTKESTRATAHENKYRTQGIIQEPGTLREAQKKQTDQESAREEQKKETPVLTRLQIRETPASQGQPQVLSQINADARPAGTVRNFAMLADSSNILTGKTALTDGSTNVKGIITTGDSIAYGGGSGGLNGQKKTEYLRKNFSYIRDMIIKRIIYPERARQMGWQGKVKVSFVISSDGFVKDIRILESSGVEILDRNAVETVKKASPFPRPPVAAQLIIPISYRLH